MTLSPLLARSARTAALSLALMALNPGSLPAAEPKTADKAPKSPKSKRAAPPVTSPLADWVEPDFPFFSSVVDARKAGAGLPGNNLTPRGIILNLGRDCWACFDPDLLRVSAIWRGRGVTPTALAPGSYHDCLLYTSPSPRD